MVPSLYRRLPAWLRQYRRDIFAGDLLAASMALMLTVPQALAYAALAGLPPYLGLYASLLPLALYALFGGQPALAVGPVAVLGVVTASALAPLAMPGSMEYIVAAAVLALLSGGLLMLFGLLRLGVLAQLLSHPVASGFISGAGVLIILSQLPPLLGLATGTRSGALQLFDIAAQLGSATPLVAALGGGSLLVLLLSRRGLPRLLHALGLRPPHALLLSRLMPMLLVLLAVALVHVRQWHDLLPVVGALPSGLPTLAWPGVELPLLRSLLLPALVVALIGFVENISIAQRLRGDQNVDADRELLALGAANLGSAFSGAMPVAASFSRSAVNAESGARTPLANLFTVLALACVLLWFTDIFRALPLAVLSAIITAAAIGLIDLRTLRHAWRYDRADAMAWLGTFGGVLLFGIEAGIALGIGLSLATLIWQASRPHIAVVGRVPGTEHFRNVLRYEVKTHDNLLFLRIDEVLFFGNVRAVEQRIGQALRSQPTAEHLVLLLSSVSRIDATALEMLHSLNNDLAGRGIKLHLAEVRGMVLDQLKRSDLLEQLSTAPFLSAFEAEVKLGGK